MASPSSILAPCKVPLVRFIIALLLLKYKPATLCIKDYLKQLSAVMRQARCRESNITSHTKLDKAPFHSNVHGRDQETILSLRTRITALEGRVENHINFNTVLPIIEGQNTGVSQGRRKRENPNSEPRSSLLAKKPRLANSSSPMQTRQDDLYESSQLSGAFTPLLVTDSTSNQFVNEFPRHIYALQCLKSNPTSDTRVIATCLEQIFEVIGQFACSVEMSEPHDPASLSGQADRNSNQFETETKSQKQLKAVSRHLPLLLQALDCIERLDHNQTLKGSVVYKFVETFKHVLERVCLLAAYCVQPSEIFSIPIISTRSKGKQREAAETSQPTITSFRPSKIILTLCELAVAMIMALDTAKPAQACMLEGCLSILMTKIGIGLKTSVFGIGLDDPIDDQPRDLERDLEEFDRTIRSQGPYLIYILERVPRPMDHDLLRNHGSALMRWTRNKLQNTLLNAVYGPTPFGLFKPSMETPELPAEFPEFEGVEAKEVGDWYTQEVWRLVGWDVLEEHLRAPT